MPSQCREDRAHVVVKVDLTLFERAIVRIQKAYYKSEDSSTKRIEPVIQKIL